MYAALVSTDRIQLAGYAVVDALRTFRQFGCVVSWVNRCQAYEMVLATTRPVRKTTTLRHRWQIEFVNLSAGNNKSLETPRDAVSVADPSVAITIRIPESAGGGGRRRPTRRWMRMPWDAGNPIPMPYPCYAPLDGLSNSVSVRRLGSVLPTSRPSLPHKNSGESDVKL